MRSIFVPVSACRRSVDDRQPGRGLFGDRFTDEESLRSINLRVNDRFFRLADIATVKRGYADPPQPMFRFNGKPAIGLAIGMRANGDLLEFGKTLEERMEKIAKELPAGIGDRLLGVVLTLSRKTFAVLEELLAVEVGQ